MRTFYTQSFKIEAVRKFLNKKTGETYNKVASQLGVSKTTLFIWVKQARGGKMTELSSKGFNEKSPQEWTNKEKFYAILETTSLNAEEKNSYCRRKGIFPHHLESWKKEFITKENKTETNINELKLLRSKTKSLQKEIKRKDKALAEASALLILKKKAQMIWGNDEEL